MLMQAWRSTHCFAQMIRCLIQSQGPLVPLLFLFLGSNYVLFHGSFCRHHSLPDPTQLNWTFEVVLLFSYQLTLCCRVLFFYRESFCILPLFCASVKNFFHLFYLRLSCLSDATCIFYYIQSDLSSTFLFSFVFLPKKQKRIRRRRDLNPRTAWTVYTLSRGASSATWVLLHMPKYNKILNSPCKAAQRYIILANPLHIVKL